MISTEFTGVCGSFSVAEVVASQLTAPGSFPVTVVEIAVSSEVLRKCFVSLLPLCLLFGVSLFSEVGTSVFWLSLSGLCSCLFRCLLLLLLSSLSLPLRSLLTASTSSSSLTILALTTSFSLGPTSPPPSLPLASVTPVSSPSSTAA
ncbi:hypothetical protein GBAR_LOCUS20707, partial [Geodia barretti]